MGFRIRHDESPAENYRRILLEQGRTLIRSLDKVEVDRVKAIHEARKSCKRSRSILRLLSKHAKARCQEENGVFREVARALSPYRDADVRLRTLDLIEKRYEGDATELAPLRELLAEKPDATVPWALPTAVERARQSAVEARERLRMMELPAITSFEFVETGLKRSYKRGRQAMKASLKSGDDEAVHEWRKRVKDLDYQLQTLRPLWPPVLKGFHKELDELADVLGEHNDNVVLLRDLRERAPELMSAKAMRTFTKTVEEMNVEIRARAEEIGQRLYAEKPKAFLKRLGTYWDAWWDEGRPASSEVAA